MCKKRKQRKKTLTKDDRRKRARKTIDWTIYSFVSLFFTIAFIATLFMTIAYSALKNPATFYDEIEDNNLGIDEYWTIASFHIDGNFTLHYRIKVLDFNAKLSIYIADSNQVILNNGSYEIVTYDYINTLNDNNYLADQWEPPSKDYWQIIIINKGYSAIRFNIEIEVVKDYPHVFVRFSEWLKEWNEIILGPVIAIVAILLGISKIDQWATKKFLEPHETQPITKAKPKTK